MSRQVELKPENLGQFTEDARVGRAINWYRSPIAPELLKALHKRSNWRGAAQTLGYLGLLVLTGGATLYSSWTWPWWCTAGLLFLHGTVGSFLINGVHELGHGTVFRTPWLNRFFVHILAFLGWINHEMFGASHTRHHRYTLHPPDDLEVVLPIRLMARHFLLSALINVPEIHRALKDTVRIARGRFRGEWEETLFPTDKPELRRAPVRWARVLLAGHATILIVSLVMGWWTVPLVVSCPGFIGGWLFFLCNNTQHIGLQDNVSDFRLCSRTFTLSPLVSFLYWRMNYHIEHHMYAAVPCYNLARLHHAIKNDLPRCHHGLIAVWREIIEIQKKQESDPAYQHVVKLPEAVLS